MAQWSFAIVADIHVFSSGQVPASFATVVARLTELAPRFVVVAGDATVGNEDDGVGADKVRLWWQSFQQALGPLRAAGIPVLAIAGNHDYYTAAHRSEYLAAWPTLASDFAAVAPLLDGGNPPLCYALDLDGVHLSFIHTVDQKLEPEVADWLRRDLEAAASAGLRLVIGHVPLVSMIGRTSETFKAQLGSLLAQGQVAAYFSGHEHLVWEQELQFSGGTVRQVHVGTASGTYHYPLNQSTCAASCQGDHGTIPLTGTRFALRPGTHLQADKVNVCVVDIDGTDFTVRHLSLRAEQLQPFGE
jgi:3',5'-cyclic AMP phosphodiesterase CpdA